MTACGSVSEPRRSNIRTHLAFRIMHAPLPRSLRRSLLRRRTRGPFRHFSTRQVRDLAHPPLRRQVEERWADRYRPCGLRASIVPMASPIPEYAAWWKAGGRGEPPAVVMVWLVSTDTAVGARIPEGDAAAWRRVHRNAAVLMAWARPVIGGKTHAQPVAISHTPAVMEHVFGSLWKNEASRRLVQRCERARTPPWLPAYDADFWTFGATHAAGPRTT